MAKGGYRGPMMGGGVNMNMIRQAQKMQQEMLKMQQEMEVKEFTAAARRRRGDGYGQRQA